MSRESQWSVDQWREGLASLSVGMLKGWRATPEAAAFYEQVSLTLGKPLGNIASGWGYKMDAAEITQMVVEMLLSAPAMAESCILADNPVAYLYRCSERRLQEEYGSRWGRSADDLYDYVSVPADPGWQGVSMAVAVDLTVAELLPFTPKVYHEHLMKVIDLLATNPPQRMSYTDREREYVQSVCPIFTAGQIQAISNVVWGGRPNQETTSLTGWFLKDPAWKPDYSPSHMRALRLYADRMYAETPPKYLFDEVAS